jgi:hypothetical protein
MKISKRALINNKINKSLEIEDAKKILIEFFNFGISDRVFANYVEICKLLGIEHNRKNVTALGIALAELGETKNKISNVRLVSIPVYKNRKPYEKKCVSVVEGIDDYGRTEEQEIFEG